MSASLASRRETFPPTFWLSSTRTASQVRAKSQEGRSFVGRQRTRSDGDACYDLSQFHSTPSLTIGTGYQLTGEERQNLVSSAVFIYFAKQLQAQRMMNQEGLPPVYHYAPEVCVTLDGEVKAVSVTINETDATSLLVRDGDDWIGRNTTKCGALSLCHILSTIS